MNTVFNKLLEQTGIPRFFCMHYDIPQSESFDPGTELLQELQNRKVLETLTPGSSVALACGSREINHFSDIVACLIQELKKRSIRPFIVPAMGSHGGASAEGQKEVLASYGITESALGVPIRSSMETLQIGTTDDGIPVHIDKIASQADYIIPIGRIKPHTDFHGPIESGLMKMLVIGLGKQQGASLCHQRGFPSMSNNIRNIARIILKKMPVPFGIGILEDAFHETYCIRVLPRDELETEEIKLLRQAKELIPIIPFEKIDVLLISEMGKNISGPGMDPNITGRSLILGRTKPNATCIAVLDLTEKSHGNANGIGCADVSTQRLIDKFDPYATFPNGITTRDPDGCRIPMYMPNDELALKLSIHLCNLPDQTSARIVWIRNTLSLNTICISEALKEAAAAVPALSPRGTAFSLPFDTNGNIPLHFWNSLTEEKDV